MTNTPHLNITLLSQAQSSKEVTINLAFQILEMLQNTGVISMALATPPVSPAEGDLYVVAGSPTGVWTGQSGKFAYFINGGWIFITPLTGVIIWDENTSEAYVYYSAAFHNLITATGIFNPTITTPASYDILTYNGVAWVNTAAPRLPELGVNATADATNKLNVATSAVLFSNIGGDCKTFINKHAAGDGGSVIFETNFSERAEFGCIGDDDFQLKVSPDGSTFYQSWVIDKSTGNADFKQNVTVDKNLTLTQFLSLPAASTLTIASGVVTATKSHHKIETESGAGTDDLDTINGGTGNVILVIEPNNGAHTVVVKNGTGNIKNKSGADVSLTGYGSNWFGFWDGSNWIQIA